MKNTREIQIRFVEGWGLGRVAWNFLRALGLANNSPQQFQWFQLTDELKTEIFGMPVTLHGDEFPSSDIWECAVIEKDECYRFLINGHTISASIEKNHDFNIAARHLPDHIQHLRLIRQPLTNLNVISNLGSLKYLDLRECSLLKDISRISSFPSLKSLNLNSCQSLTDIAPIGCLTSLTSLEMQSCMSLADIGAISYLSELEYLSLDYCESINDIKPLRELSKLIVLSLHYCKSISRIDELSSLQALETLNLQGCESLIDVSALSGLASLTSLNLSNCQALTDISALAGLTSLIDLNLSLCHSITDISSISSLTFLDSLNLLHCKSLSDISAIKNLNLLTSLGLGNWPDFGDPFSTSGIVDISALSGLRSIAELRLEHCKDLTNIGPLENLSSLTKLEISNCSSISDLTPVSGLARLSVLKLKSCYSVKNIDALSGLTALRELNLNEFSALTDLAALSKLTSLTMLCLNNCRLLADISSVSSITSLKELVLSGCERITSLSMLSCLTGLVKLDISHLKRLRTTQTLQEIRPLVALEELNSPFHPALVGELLAHTAVCRCDLNKISQSAREWLQESINFSDGDLSEQEQFAATLGSAFSLLGNHEVIPDYEAFLDERSDFSPTPWKAWLGGLKKNQGHTALVRSVERVDLALCSAGAIGGICATLPSSEALAEEQEWARDWLARMETAQASNAKNLITVCAEICLAHARLGLQEALQRWLGRFTDASDPEALDPVHEALGHWQLQLGDTTAASEHAWSIRDSQVRDPLLGKLVESCYENDPALACKALLYIVSLSLRANLASHLVAQETFASDARNMQCLIVACDSSIEAMTQLIKQAHPKADPTHLRALSEKLLQQSQHVPENQENSHHNEIR